LQKCSRLQPPGKELFLRGEKGGTDGLNKVTTFQVDQRVHKSTELTEDSFLLVGLSLGDMVALEAKYRTKCLLTLYNSARKVQAAQQQTSNEENEISGIVFVELVMYTLKKFVQKFAHLYPIMLQICSHLIVLECFIVHL